MSDASATTSPHKALRNVVPDLDAAAKVYLLGSEDVREALDAMLDAPEGEWQKRLFASGQHFKDVDLTDQLWNPEKPSLLRSGAWLDFYLRRMVLFAQKQRLDDFNRTCQELSEYLTEEPDEVANLAERQRGVAQSLMARSRDLDRGATLEGVREKLAAVGLKISSQLLEDLKAKGLLKPATEDVLTHWIDPRMRPAWSDGRHMPEVGYRAATEKTFVDESNSTTDLTQATHGDDFAWVRCNHGDFTFTIKQRPLIRLLWEDWEKGGLGECRGCSFRTDRAKKSFTWSRSLRRGTSR